MDNRHFSYSKFWSEYQAGERRVRTTSCNNICPGISPISRCYFSFYHYFRNPFLFLSKFKLLEVLRTKSKNHLLQNKRILFINVCISCHYFTLCSNLKTILKCLLILCIKRKQLKGKFFFPSDVHFMKVFFKSMQLQAKLSRSWLCQRLRYNVSKFKPQF